MMRLQKACLLALTTAFIWAGPAWAGRIEAIKSRGFVTCGVFPGVAGFSMVDKDGRYSGFDTDVCRIVAAAIFGAPDKVRFVTASGVDIFRRKPELDLVVRRLTWTLTREASHGLMFGPVIYYDGQGFLVPKSAGVIRAPQLAGKRVCVESGEDWVANLMRYSRKNGLDFRPVIVADRSEGKKSFFGGHCVAYSADKTMLGAIRADAPAPQDYDILPEEISKEPLAPLVRQGDDRFFQLVRWAMFVVIEAEELGVSSKNIDQNMMSLDPDTRSLLGIVAGNGKALGVSEHWAADIIRGVGNYGEIFDRNVGVDSSIRLERGLNRLWTDGGLIYAPPVR
jgi:general L-amino acid transport system substrate-binding protein